MEEFDSFIESFLSINGKPLICGDFKYWVDDLAHKPYSSEFMELLNVNNFENHVLRPRHASGHTPDLFCHHVILELIILRCSLLVPVYLIMIWYSFMLTFQKPIPSLNLSHSKGIREWLMRHTFVVLNEP